MTGRFRFPRIVGTSTSAQPPSSVSCLPVAVIVKRFRRTSSSSNVSTPSVGGPIPSKTARVEGPPRQPRIYTAKNAAAPSATSLSTPSRLAAASPYTSGPGCGPYGGNRQPVTTATSSVASATPADSSSRNPSEATTGVISGTSLEAPTTGNPTPRDGTASTTNCSSPSPSTSAAALSSLLPEEPHDLP